MFHAGFAGELSRLMVEERRSGSSRRPLSSADRARIEARQASERAARSFEHTLSVGGAAALMAIALFGTAGAVVLAAAIAVALAVAIAASGRRPADLTEAVRPPEDPELRWGIWWSVEPDPEYLRGRAA